MWTLLLLQYLDISDMHVYVKDVNRKFCMITVNTKIRIFTRFVFCCGLILDDLTHVLKGDVILNT